MKLTLKIQMDNAAFSDAPNAEVARILNKFSKDIVQFNRTYDTWNLLDYNGNTVGTATIKRQDGDPK